MPSISSRMTLAAKAVTIIVAAALIALVLSYNQKVAVTITVCSVKPVTTANGEVEYRVTADGGREYTTELPELRWPETYNVDLVHWRVPGISVPKIVKANPAAVQRPELCR